MYIYRLCMCMTWLWLSEDENEFGIYLAGLYACIKWITHADRWMVASSKARKKRRRNHHHHHHHHHKERRMKEKESKIEGFCRLKWIAFMYAQRIHHFSFLVFLLLLSFFALLIRAYVPGCWFSFRIYTSVYMCVPWHIEKVKKRRRFLSRNSR